MFDQTDAFVLVIFTVFVFWAQIKVLGQMMSVSEKLGLGSGMNTWTTTWVSVRGSGMMLASVMGLVALFSLWWDFDHDFLTLQNGFCYTIPTVTDVVPCDQTDDSIASSHFCWTSVYDHTLVDCNVPDSVPFHHHNNFWEAAFILAVTALMLQKFVMPFHVAARSSMGRWGAACVQLANVAVCVFALIYLWEFHTGSTAFWTFLVFTFMVLAFGVFLIVVAVKEWGFGFEGIGNSRAPRYRTVTTRSVPAASAPATGGYLNSMPSL